MLSFSVVRDSGALARRLPNVEAPHNFATASRNNGKIRQQIKRRRSWLGLVVVLVLGTARHGIPSVGLISEISEKEAV